MKRAHLLLLLLVLSGILPSPVVADEMLKLIGDCRAWQSIPHGIETTCSNAQVQILCYSSDIIRVRVSGKPFGSDFSYAVIQQPQSGFYEISETPDHLILRTAELTVEVQKSPFRISFYSTDNQLISEEFSDFGITWQGEEVTLHRRLFADERFIGLGEKTGPLNRRGNAYVNWNRDIPAYSDREDPLYQTIPFFIGIHDSLTYGIFLDNSFRSTFNFGASTDDLFSFFSANGGELDYYFFGARSVAGIIEDYTWLTGRMPLPPYWSIGYQQCRWGYYPDSEVISIANKFREKQIPCDVIYLDIDYMDQYKIFTWHPTRFPNPRKTVESLKEMGFHTVVIVDPGIKVEPGYRAYDEGIASDYFIRYPGGRVYTGNVWPGRCHFPDFTRAETRRWWGERFSTLVDAGVEGFWNDMNEPSAWGQSIPDLVEFDFDGHPTTMAEAHNVYGLEMARATFEGTRILLNGKRPFVLTRAGFSGVQRYSAVWSGDNSATDADLFQGVRLTTSMGLSGISFTGPDIGGFVGSPTKELFLRWLSVGVFTPFFRNHTEVNSRDQEPWAFGEDAETVARNLIGFRYRLLPYLYSMFYTSSSTGLPVARSLAIAYTFDPAVYDWRYQNQYLFGDAFLVAPVASDQRFQEVYLPEGSWYRYSTGERYAGNQAVIVRAPLHDLPVFVKAGSIVPLQSVIQSTSQRSDSILEIHLFNGETESEFLLYEDDGTSYNYTGGVSLKRTIRFDPKSRSIVFTESAGDFRSQFTAYRVIFHGFDPELAEQLITNRTNEIRIRF